MSNPPFSAGSPEERFEALYRENVRALFAFFRRRGFSVEESEDLCQQTLARAWEKLDQLKRPDNPRPWLMTIAARKRADFIAKRRSPTRGGKYGFLSADAPVSADGPALVETLEAAPRAGNDPQRDTLSADKRTQLGEAIRGLAPRMRQCLLLYEYQGYTYQEIAGLLGVELGTVRRNIHDARQRLRARLEDNFSDFDGASD